MLKFVCVIMVVVLITFAPAFASQSKTAVYQISVYFKGMSHTVTFNETVSSTSNKDWDLLFLSVFSNNWSLSYSRSVNSSHQFFPYVPSIANQTFKFNSTELSLTLSLQKNGTKQVQFQGGSYTLTTYSFTASVYSRGQSGSLRGEVEAFPSGLLYSAKLSSEKGSVSVMLLSTNLPLTLPSPSSQQQAASIIVGVGAVAAAVAGSFGIRHMRKVSVKEKPEHWVD
jgi:hypothetical protein